MRINIHPHENTMENWAWSGQVTCQGPIVNDEDQESGCTHPCAHQCSLYHTLFPRQPQDPRSSWVTVGSLSQDHWYSARMCVCLLLTEAGREASCSGLTTVGTVPVLCGVATIWRQSLYTARDFLRGLVTAPCWVSRAQATQVSR